MCGIRRCRYFDDSMEGTRRFMEAVTEAHGTIAGVLAERERQADHRRRAVN
jgi:hypothetical protein